MPHAGGYFNGTSGVIIGPSSSGISGSPSNAGLGAALDNHFTGNLDFYRQTYLFDKQVAANNAAAASDRKFTAEQNALNRAFNAEQVQKLMNFQDEQSRTQYLRAAEQLKQLGINPAVLAFGGSAGSAAAMSGHAASASGGSGGSHHVSGSSWSRSAANGFSDLLRLTGTMANSAAIVFRALSFMR